MKFKPALEVLEVRETPAMLSRAAVVLRAVQSAVPPPSDPTTPVTTAPDAPGKPGKPTTPPVTPPSIPLPPPALP